MIVGPKTIKIETYLSFDDEQNEEMESVMINVREIKCKVRETGSRTWDWLTYVRLNTRTWNGAKLETEATGMIKAETNVRETQCNVREMITRTWRSFICTWNMNWRKAGKRSLEIFEESKTHVRETRKVTYASYTRQEEDFIPEYVGSNFTRFEESSWSNGQNAWSHVRENNVTYVR